MIPYNAVTHTRHGAMIYHRLDTYIGGSIDRYGEFSPDESDFLCALVGPGSTVLDGGANIGALSLPLARVVGPMGKVFAIEPQEQTYYALCGNVALNSLNNVKALRVALGRAPGTLLVPALDLLQPNNVGGLELGKFTVGEKVPVVRIDDLGLPGLTLLKLDIEGGERAALAGARRTIKQFQPILYVEADREEQRPGLIQDLRGMGYQLFWHTPPLFRRHNWRGTEANAFGDIGSINILGLPAHDPRDFGLPPVEVDDGKRI
jgi:FkbM family methyltransferase